MKISDRGIRAAAVSCRWVGGEGWGSVDLMGFCVLGPLVEGVCVSNPAWGRGSVPQLWRERVSAPSPVVGGAESEALWEGGKAVPGGVARGGGVPPRGGYR